MSSNYDLSIGSSPFKTLKNIENSENNRSESSIRISSATKLSKTYDNIVLSTIGGTVKTEIDRYNSILDSSFYSRGILETAENSLSVMTTILQRMSTLALQSNVVATYSAMDRAKLNDEFQKLKDELERTALSTTFNGKNILSGNQTLKLDSMQELRSNHLEYDDPLRTNFLGQEKGFGGGIHSIEFNKDKYDYNAIKISYDSTNNFLKLKDLNNNIEESVKISNHQIEPGVLEKVRFNAIDLNLTLNSNFDKSKSFGEEFADINDPTNLNNELINTGLNVTKQDANGNESNSFHFKSINIKNISGRITDLASTQIKIAKNINNAWQKFSEGGDELVLEIETADGHENFIAKTGMSIKDFEVGKKYQIALTRKELILHQDITSDKIVLEFELDANNLDNTDIFSKNDTFINLNEIKNTKFSYLEREDFMKFTFQIGTGFTKYDKIDLSIQSLSNYALGLERENLNLLSKENSNISKNTVNEAINTILALRGSIGVAMNRIDFASTNINAALTHTKGLESEIYGVDIPTELLALSNAEMQQTAAVDALSKEIKSKGLILKLVQ